ncbi:hypothetical protein ACHAWF_003163, partial [Thalassiosira exigua]
VDEVPDHDIPVRSLVNGRYSHPLSAYIVGQIEQPQLAADDTESHRPELVASATSAVGVSDGSVDPVDGRGAFAWVICLPGRTAWVKGRHPKSHYGTTTYLNKLEVDLTKKALDDLACLPKVSVTHVLGHQDDETPYDALPFEAQLNANCDVKAKGCVFTVSYDTCRHLPRKEAGPSYTSATTWSRRSWRSKFTTQLTPGPS